MLRMAPGALALSMAWGLPPALASAQDNQSWEQKAALLSEVTVSATRGERRVDDVPTTVSVITRRQIEQGGARDLKDMLGNEADVSVRVAPSRFSAAGPSTGRAGVESVNIRGLEGNQVLIMQDGIRVPNAFSFGPFATGRGDYIDLDGIKSAEVLRGPSSTQYGSDGLAGAVIIRTLDPADLLRGQQALGGFARSRYSSADRSWANSVGVAGRNDRWQALLLGSYRSGHEPGNKGDNDSRNADRTTPNPVDQGNRYLLGKLMFDASPRHQFGVTLETQRRQLDTEVYSARAKAPLTAASILDLDTRDHVRRDRVLIGHRFSDAQASLMQRAETRVYWQDATVGQFSAEDHHTAADRTRDNTYRSRLVGVSTMMESNPGGPLEQRLSYGFDWSQAQVSGVRDGTVPPHGETFPAKAFPDTRYTLAGAFVQSEIEAGAFGLTPALRIDHYKLEPSSSGYAGGAVATASGSAVTPRFGVIWRAAPALAPYLQWTRGFRAPSPEQVNQGFGNIARGYTSIGNPDLKAERANSIEIGVRGKQGELRYSLSAFDNRYDNFISQQSVGGAGTPMNPTVHQFVNLEKARIRGIEARSEWAIDSRWTASLGAAWAEGDSEAKGVSVPLDTVNPLKAVLGVRYDGGEWAGRAHLVHSQAKSPGRIAPARIPQFAPPAYTVLDLGMSWKPARNLSLNANVNNVLDAKYWRWSDVRGLAGSSDVRDAYTAPGRNFNVALRYDF